MTDRIVLTPEDLDNETVVVDGNRVSARAVVSPTVPEYKEGRLFFDTGTYNRLFVGLEGVYVEASPCCNSMVVTDAFDGSLPDSFILDAFE